MSAALGVGLEVDVDEHLGADLVRRAGRGLHDRDEDAEHEHGDEHRGDRRERRHGVAAQRAQRLAQEEAEPHSSPSRQSAPNSRVVSLAAVAAGALVAHDAALGDLDHAPAHAVDHRLVVRRDDDRRAGAVDPVEQLHDPDRRLGIEVAGRLVGQQQRRVVDERARDRDALLLAAGELVGIVVQLGREAGEAQDVGHLLAHLAARPAGHLQRVGDVVVDRPVRQQLEVLEDDAEVAAVVRDLLARDLGQVAPGDRDRAVARLDLLDQQAHDRRLARAGRADEEDELAGVDRERRVLEPHVAAGVLLRDRAQVDDRARHRVADDALARRGGLRAAPDVAFGGSHLRSAGYFAPLRGSPPCNRSCAPR